MATAYGAGTEIIRAHHFKDIDATESILIFGVVHHIYTVLSVISYCVAVQATGNLGHLIIKGYDSKIGDANGQDEDISIAKWALIVGETFVWNDKFSFNGFEPANLTGALSTEAEQTLLVAQGGSNAQKLVILSTNAADQSHVHVTFIDQNNDAFMVTLGQPKNILW